MPEFRRSSNQGNITQKLLILNRARIIDFFSNLARLSELCELINMEKEEQAIEPAFFTGNQKDYPRWFIKAFSEKERLATLEQHSHYQPGDLDDYDMDDWYDDLFACPSFNFVVQADEEQANQQALTYEVEAVEYAWDTPHAWILISAGALQLGPVRRATESE